MPRVTNEMKILDVPNADSLEALGTVAQLRQDLQKIVSPLKVEAETYDDLFEVVQMLKEKWVDAIPGPFVSRRAEAIFYLTKLDGEIRNQLLGLTDQHFVDPALARSWYRSLRQLVHSGRPGGSHEAFIALQKLYSIISFEGDEDE